MSRIAIYASSVALALSTVPAQAAEVVSVSFATPNGGQSVGLYSGIVNVQVEGFGASQGNNLNDAFYQFTSINSCNCSNYYQMTFGTVPLVGLNTSQDVRNYLVGPAPAYSPDHIYNFQLNTGLVNPGILYFGVSDGDFTQNTGSYRVTLNAGAVPEPASWAMMLLGFGAIGACMRRRQPARRPALQAA